MGKKKNAIFLVVLNSQNALGNRSGQNSKKGLFLHKTRKKFGSFTFGSVRFDVRGLKLGSIEFGIWKLDSNRVREKAVRTHV